ncbi:YbaK/EbsC family protein [Micromonospora sp. WMMD1128]|uniref:YbaK/EbsC family protein n=1 Tax=unclassified Micromonospora TaxID=2617518 RepID=UPI00248B2528|nr:MULTISPECIES: YbaK/EbsC family protein [unclassified Micromonospora]WBB75661.1 YbaK/EbsC family protein [Micromonospora sp. WMMD1128]WFE36553.1 YbaK/EbsC family protein [Micromonospora sp. WMMD975]
MTESRDALPTPMRILDRAGAAYAVTVHRAIRTADDVTTWLDLPVERSVKTLAFEGARDGLVLAVLPGPARLDYRGLAEAVGTSRSRLRPADPAALDVLDMEPGGASPLSDAEGVVTVFDVTVAGMGPVYCGSGRNDRTLQVDGRDLLRLARNPREARIARPAG